MPRCLIHSSLKKNFFGQSRWPQSIAPWGSLMRSNSRGLTTPGMSRTGPRRRMRRFAICLLMSAASRLM